MILHITQDEFRLAYAHAEKLAEYVFRSDVNHQYSSLDNAWAHYYGTIGELILHKVFNQPIPAQIDCAAIVNDKGIDFRFGKWKFQVKTRTQLYPETWLHVLESDLHLIKKVHGIILVSRGSTDLEWVVPGYSRSDDFLAHAQPLPEHIAKSGKPSLGIIAQPEWNGVFRPMSQLLAALGIRPQYLPGFY